MEKIMGSLGRAGILAILLVLATWGSSCDPCRRLARICPLLVDTTWEVRVDTFLETRDTTITVEIPIPGETVRDTVRIQVRPDGLVNSDTAWAETPLARSWAYVHDRILVVQVEQKDTVLVVQAQLRDAVKTIRILRDSVSTIQAQVIIEKKTDRKKQRRAIIFGLLVAVLLFAGGYFIKAVR